jgi:hypothetical protein
MDQKMTLPTCPVRSLQHHMLSSQGQMTAGHFKQADWEWWPQQVQMHRRKAVDHTPVEADAVGQGLAEASRPVVDSPEVTAAEETAVEHAQANAAAEAAAAEKAKADAERKAAAKAEAERVAAAKAQAEAERKAAAEAAAAEKAKADAERRAAAKAEAERVAAAKAQAEAERRAAAEAAAAEKATTDAERRAARAAARAAWYKAAVDRQAAAQERLAALNPVISLIIYFNSPWLIALRGTLAVLYFAAVWWRKTILRRRRRQRQQQPVPDGGPAGSQLSDLDEFAGDEELSNSNGLPAQPLLSEWLGQSQSAEEEDAGPSTPRPRRRQQPQLGSRPMTRSAAATPVAAYAAARRLVAGTAALLPARAAAAVDYWWLRPNKLVRKPASPVGSPAGAVAYRWLRGRLITVLSGPGAEGREVEGLVADQAAFGAPFYSQRPQPSPAGSPARGGSGSPARGSPGGGGFISRPGSPVVIQRTRRRLHDV